MAFDHDKFDDARFPLELEDELRNALQRQDPSPGFAARVVAKADESCEPRKVLAMPVGAGRWRVAWAVGLAAVLTVGLMVNAQYRQMRAERAAREAVAALRLTAEKLNFARAKVLDLSRPRPESGN